MKKRHNIQSIKMGFTCNEDWSRMEGDDRQRACEACQQIVYNFEEYSTQELIDFLSARRKQRMCGRLSTEQIAAVNRRLAAERPKINWRPTVAAAALTAMLSCGNPEKPEYRVTERYDQINPTEVVVRGVVLDNETEDPIIGASIFLSEDPQFGVDTDLDGLFELKIPSLIAQQNNLVASYLGFERVEMPLNEVHNSSIRVNMSEDESEMYNGYVLIQEPPAHIQAWNALKDMFSK